MSPETATTSEYELVLMLDPEAPDDRRDQIASEARKRIENSGELKHDAPWGMRKLAYEIRQRTEADYRFFRFAGASPLLDELDHNLKITDGVLRFRIFKVDADAPTVGPPAPVAAATGASRGRGGRRDDGPPADRRDPRGPADRPKAEAAEPEPAQPEAVEAAEPEASEAAGPEPAEAADQSAAGDAEGDAAQPAEGDAQVDAE